MRNLIAGSEICRLCLSVLAGVIILQGQVAAKDMDVLLFDAQDRAKPNYNSTKVAEQLNSIFAAADGFGQSSATQVDVGGMSLLESWYNPDYSDATRQALDGDYDVVVMFPTSFFARKAPEAEFEAVRAMGDYVLNNGAVPLYVMDAPSAGDLPLAVNSGYRVANGCGIDLVPAGLAADAAGLLKPSAGLDETRQTYLTAATIFSQLTGLNAYDTGYVPMYDGTPIDGANLATIAQSVLSDEETAVHYTGDYATSGAVRYRPLDASQAPFYDNVRYFYKGTSTETGMHSYLGPVIRAQGLTPLGTRITGGNAEHKWEAIDTTLATPVMAPYPDQFLFMYTRWTTVDGQSLIDLNQANLMPLDYDRHALNIGTGPSSTSNMLKSVHVSAVNSALNHDSYNFQGVMFHVAVARFHEADPTVSGSNDGTHLSAPMYYTLVSMIVSSALGIEPTPPAAVLGNAQYLAGFNIGHRTLKELAFISEDARNVPDTALRITTDELPTATTGVELNIPLSATAGTPPYTWKEVSDDGLPAGVSLSADGVLNGTPAAASGVLNLVFKVTDSNHAIRKKALRFRVADDVPSDAAKFPWMLFIPAIIGPII